jgi:hypothetical protein
MQTHSEIRMINTNATKCFSAQRANANEIKIAGAITRHGSSKKFAIPLSI